MAEGDNTNVQLRTPNKEDRRRLFVRATRETIRTPKRSKPTVLQEVLVLINPIKVRLILCQSCLLIISGYITPRVTLSREDTMRNHENYLMKIIIILFVRIHENAVKYNENMKYGAVYPFGKKLIAIIIIMLIVYCAVYLLSLRFTLTLMNKV